MSEENWKLEKDLCRCCLNEGSFKNLAEPCLNQGEEEIYSEMLLESLDINLVPVSGPLCSSTYTICEECILRLRDACSFKRQVLLSEKRFRDLYRRDVIELNKSVTVKHEESYSDMEGAVKLEVDHDDDNDDFKLNYDDDNDADNKIDIHLEPQAKKPRTRKPKAKEKPKPTAKKRGARPRKLKAEVDAETTVEAEAEAENKAETDKQKKDVPKGEDEYIVEGAGPDKKFRCKHCLHLFKSIRTVKTHIRSIHKTPKQNVICDICKKEFTNKMYLIKHLYTHPSVGAHCEPKKIVCKICQRPVITSMARHLELHGVYKCEFCSSEFPGRSELVQHEKEVHDVQIKRSGKKFVCDSCGKELWGRLRDLISHLRTHGLYRCEKCPAEFGDTKSLKAHYNDAHPLPVHTCGVCGYKTTNIHTSIAHQRNVHMKERTIACPHCDQMFFSASMLNMHMVRHNPVKKFECRFCKKMFPRSETRRRHEKIHTEEKRKVCTICDKRFVQKASLSYHLKKYHPEAV